MPNPWTEIPLEDYESHMKLDCVMQLQAMNGMMRRQFDAYPVSSVMILGIAGGNGLKHLQRDRFRRVYGVDINPSYLQAVVNRYPELAGVLECLCVDLTEGTNRLPQADLILANLLIEYIGYECFQTVVRQVKPKYVSCIIQLNLGDGWVSDSPYLHIFDGLEEVHHQMEAAALERTMAGVGYHVIQTWEHTLPNGKKLVQMDFERERHATP